MSQERTKIKLIPESKLDRLAAAVGVIVGLLGVLYLVLADTFGGYFWGVFCVVGSGLNLMSAYLFQSVPKTAGTDEYAEMIAQIEGTRDALQTLNEFLEKERKRVQETEEAVNRLNQEHDALLPVVQTKREDVEAILAVHARATKRSAWKERLVGFGLGLFASILTGGVFYLLEIWRQRLE